MFNLEKHKYPYLYCLSMVIIRRRAYAMRHTTRINQKMLILLMANPAAHDFPKEKLNHLLIGELVEGQR